VTRAAVSLPEVPVKRVRFFESGIAEYERTGSLTGGVVALRRTNDQLDKATKEKVTSLKGILSALFAP